MDTCPITATDARGITWRCIKDPAHEGAHYDEQIGASWTPDGVSLIVDGDRLPPGAGLPDDHPLRREIAQPAGIETREVGTQRRTDTPEMAVRRTGSAGPKGSLNDVQQQVGSRTEASGMGVRIPENAEAIEAEKQDVVRRLAYLPFGESETGVSTNARRMGEQFGFFIVTKLPNSRERALALTHLEEVLTWINKAIRGGVR